MDKPKIFYGVRLRHGVALLACVAVILIVAGYFSVSAGQRAALDAVRTQGRALTGALLASASMIIESDNEITAVVIEWLLATVKAFRLGDAVANPSVLDDWRLSLSAAKVSLVRDGDIETSSSARLSGLKDDDIEAWLDSLDVAPDDEVIYEFRTIDKARYFWGYFPSSKEDDQEGNLGLFVAKKWEYGQYGNRKLGLYYLLNKVGQESGVEYIMLQNRGGIVFASKKVASMTRIADDPFLAQSLESDTARSRLLHFQDRQVLETVKKFKSGEFEGVFRVGLSLYGYRQIAAGIRRQVWLAVVALIILGVLGVGLVVGFQNYDLLKASFHKAQLMSRSLLDSIPGPVVAVDSDMKITDVNAVARRIFGLPSDALVGSEYEAAFSGDLLLIRQAMRSQRVASCEKSIGNDNRRYYITATPLVGSEGKLLGAMAVAQDITEARKLEAVAESRRRFSELGALAASMAHEIRNPLNAIGITIQRMKQEVQPKSGQDEYEKFLDGLKREVARLNDIIGKFLAVARSIRPHMAKQNLSDLISQASELFKDEARARGIKLNTTVPPNLAVECDRDGIVQALVNVIKNSLEAIQKGGRVEISVRELESSVRISVVDDGPGFSDVSWATKPFYTTKKDGTGLGLSTSSKILADHGGELVIESSPGKGCRVDLVLPRRRDGQ